MLLQSPTPAWQPPQPAEASTTSAPASAPEHAPFAGLTLDGDDEDEALQAILLASLQEEANATLSAKAMAEQEAQITSCVRPPLVGKPTAISDFVEDCAAALSEPVKASLKELSCEPHNLMWSRVRGDGHCLYRVVAGSLVLGAAWGGRAAVDAMLEHLASPLLHQSTAAREACELIKDLVASEDVLKALNEEQAQEGAAVSRSDALVSALRRCAVEYMRAHTDRFRHCSEGFDSSSRGGSGSGSSSSSGGASVAAAVDGSAVAEGSTTEGSTGAAVKSKDGAAASPDEEFASYCESMADMAQARYGGHPELVALSEALRVRVDIHDVTSTSGGQMATYRLGEHLPDGCPIVRGLRKGLHFNLLLRASAEGVEMA